MVRSSTPQIQLTDLATPADQFKANSMTFCLWPKQWVTYARSHGWKLIKLEAPKKSKIPKSAGIYTLLLQPGIAGHPSCSYLMYVGQATSLQKRFRDYLGRERLPTGRPKVVEFLRKYSNYVWFCYMTAKRKSLDNIEDGLLTAYIPPLNDKFKGEIGRARRAFV